jgi:hypothetical protein
MRNRCPQASEHLHDMQLTTWMKNVDARSVPQSDTGRDEKFGLVRAFSDGETSLSMASACESAGAVSFVVGEYV